jgi:inward rectifier potassium channel
MNNEDFVNNRVEFMILLQGFDDTFSQTVHSRFSYYYNEIIWGAKFINIYGVNKEGKTTVAMDRLNEYEIVPLNPVKNQT